MANRDHEDTKDKMDIDDNSDSNVEQVGNPGDNAPESTSPKEDRSYLDEIPDGAGCTEIWEHLSQGRDE
jgi:hypothetical protein